MPPFPNYWWSEPLHKSHRIVKYWEVVISFQRNDIDGTTQLDTLEEEIGPELDIYQGNKEETPMGQLRRAKING
eukprot:7016451-Ditylum_brightwellii.AAC.1